MAEITEWKCETLNTYLKTLTHIYLTNSKYPYGLPPIYGIPYYKYVHTINSASELIGYIKILAQLCNVTEITVKTNNTEKTLKLGEL